MHHTGRLRIIRRTDKPFAGRAEAGELLAWELRACRGRDTVVVGIPYGGAIVAREIASFLDIEADVLISRRMYFPGRPEFSIGAVAEGGVAYFDPGLGTQLCMERTYVHHEKAARIAQLQRETDYFRGRRPRLPVEGKTVILADDCAVTGCTAAAALQSLRAGRPAALVIALPAAPLEALGRLGQYADEVVCLRAPHFWDGAARWYPEPALQDAAAVLSWIGGTVGAGMRV